MIHRTIEIQMARNETHLCIKLSINVKRNQVVCPMCRNLSVKPLLFQFETEFTIIEVKLTANTQNNCVISGPESFTTFKRSTN